MTPPDSTHGGGGRNPAPAFHPRFRAALAALFSAWIGLSAGCRPASSASIAAISPAASAAGPAATSLGIPDAPGRVEEADAPLLDEVERRTFDFFWELTNAKNGLVPDRSPTPSFASIAAVGFGLTAYPIGAERGYITREAARERVLTTLRFFSGGAAGAHGFWYHFLDMKTGARFKDVELSTIDSALLLAGALFCQSFFDREDPAEAEIRELAERLYLAADWTWWQHHPPMVSMGWTPEEGFNEWDWRGYNEGMIVYVLALGSPTHPIPAAAWNEYTRTYKWEKFQGQEYVCYGSLFCYQYSHVWIDFRGIRDAYMRERGIDYFENSRRATYAHRQYAIQNPGGWRGYGENTWGLSACDGPIDGDVAIDGRKRHFFTYAARGACAHEVRDDGTITPTAAASSLPFAPEIVLPAIEEMKNAYGDRLFSKYGFLDAFNPTFRAAVPVQHGRVAADGWFDTDYLGIDQGPIVAMIENARTDLVWTTMRRNPHIVEGLRRAGFTGGWLESAAPAAIPAPAPAAARKAASRRPGPTASIRRAA
ncbi:MAG: glucoamylase family protein [Acidobacteriota bacterium]